MTESTYTPRRSVLYMPSSNARALDKAKTLPVDALILDLEDAVGPDDKPAAREAACAAVRSGEYGDRELTIRVNGIGTQWHDEDLAAAAKAGPAGIVVPKVNSAQEVEQLVAASGHHSTQGVEGEPLDLLGGDRRRDRQLLAFGDDVDERRAVVGEGLAQARLEIGGLGDPPALDAAGLGDLREVGIVQVGAEGDDPGRLHLQLHEVQRRVVEHDDLDRQPVLRQRDELAEEHGQATVTGEGHHLPVTIDGLGADGQRQRTRHGAVVERSQQPAAAVHGEVARRPDHR